ncbi:MAG: hypothetical protein CBD38_00500 [bacterium TMED178]|nr:MAG: hypothetical protein CBD38_00500 [bacterium TMED178]
MACGCAGNDGALAVFAVAPGHGNPVFLGSGDEVVAGGAVGVVGHQAKFAGFEVAVFFKTVYHGAVAQVMHFTHIFK